MNIKKLEEGIKLRDAIEDYKLCLDTINEAIKKYNIQPDIKYKIKNIFTEQIEVLTTKLENL